MTRKLKDWPGTRVVMSFPGHPDDGSHGTVIRVRRANVIYEQRATVRWDDGEVSVVPVSSLHTEADR